MFERKGEWSGYQITKSKSGFVVSFWSRVQGDIDKSKYLYRFDNTFTQNTNLEESWNDLMTYGEFLADTIRERYNTGKEYNNNKNIKCLSKGQIVY